MKVAIQGELGSFSHQAALRSIPDAEVLPCALSADAFERLRKGEVDAIMIPIENTLAGSVVEHYDLLREHSVSIERETVIRIEHNLIGLRAARSNRCNASTLIRLPWRSAAVFSGASWRRAHGIL